jgi:hypothetical protein
MDKPLLQRKILARTSEWTCNRPSTAAAGRSLRIEVAPDQHVGVLETEARRRNGTPCRPTVAWLKLRINFPRNTRSPVNQCPEHVKKTLPVWALPGTVCVTAAVPTLGSTQITRVSAYPVSRPKRGLGAVRRVCQGRRETRDWDCESALPQQALYAARVQATAISRKERQPSSCRPWAKSATL